MGRSGENGLGKINFAGFSFSPTTAVSLLLEGWGVSCGKPGPERRPNQKLFHAATIRKTQRRHTDHPMTLSLLRIEVFVDRNPFIQIDQNCEELLLASSPAFGRKLRSSRTSIRENLLQATRQGQFYRQATRQLSLSIQGKRSPQGTAWHSLGTSSRTQLSHVRHESLLFSDIRAGLTDDEPLPVCPSY